MCIVETCDRKNHSQGYCGMHYARVKRHGDPGKLVRLRGAPLIDRLWFRTTVVGDCWKFDGPILHFVRSDDRGDYRGIRVGDEYKGVHVVSYELHHGPLLPDQQVHHRCETKECWRPEHLEALTPLEHRRKHMKDECRHGHEYTPENTIQHKSQRRCRTCVKASRDRMRARIRAERAAQ